MAKLRGDAAEAVGGRAGVREARAGAALWADEVQHRPEADGPGQPLHGHEAAGAGSARRTRGELRLAPAGRDPDAAAEKLTALLRGSEERPAPLVLRVRAAGAAIPSAVGAALAAQAQGAGTLHAVQTGLAAARGGARAGPEVVLQLRSTEAARRARAARWRSIVDGAAAAEGAAMPKPNLLRLMKDFRLVERALREQSPVPSCGLVHCEPIEDSLLDWEVGMRFPDDSVLQRGLQHLADLGRDAETHLTLRVRFPLGYPASPPEVWVQRPRLIHRSAPVTFGGKMCNELLSVAGWRPESTALQVLEGVQLGFLSSDTQVDCSVPWRVPYLRPHPVLERLKTELISTEN
ncbi:unnamed protein product [Prorocentrum cordatum]|uniref:UBC core domain-containing protein n=1 Tax=Prorocentrum cordatum TaxID=2364126 RepID=A0ABN9RYD8_9DINO|nr:unnamed protein product [Polarella glacialis]